MADSNKIDVGAFQLRIDSPEAEELLNNLIDNDAFESFISDLFNRSVSEGEVAEKVDRILEVVEQIKSSGYAPVAATVEKPTEEFSDVEIESSEDSTPLDLSDNNLLSGFLDGLDAFS